MIIDDIFIIIFILTIFLVFIIADKKYENQRDISIGISVIVVILLWNNMDIRKIYAA